MEVTAIEAAAVSRKTGLPAEGFDEASTGGVYSLLNQAILEACKSKTAQLEGFDAPRLLAAGTTHFLASLACFDQLEMSMLLTGTVGTSFSLNPQESSQTVSGKTITQLRNAAFLKPSDDGPLLARLPISALIVGGIGIDPPRFPGLLHPDPVRPFDPEDLPGISFGKLLPGYQNGSLEVFWPPLK